MNVWYVICDIVYNICKYDVCMNLENETCDDDDDEEEEKLCIHTVVYIYIAYIDTYHLLMMV